MLLSQKIICVYRRSSAVKNVSTLISPQKVDALRAVPAFAAWIESSGDACLEFLARGEEIDLDAGEWICHAGDQAAMFLLLSGELRVLKVVGDSEMLLATHKPGAFFGEMPIMLGSPFFAGGQAVGEVHAWKLDEKAFWELFGACPAIARDITKTMALRMQAIESIAQTREKLVSLGTLAAGLAHELNNPAAAAKRAAAQLRETMREVENRAIEMHGLGFQSDQCHVLREMREGAYKRAKTQKPAEMSAMARADVEDELADWLEARGIENGFALAPTFVSADLKIEWLEQLSAQIDCRALASVVSWLEASLRADGLAAEIERSSDSISALVGSVKSYSHLDEAPQQQVDLHEGLETTLLMLKYKLRGIEITRDFSCDLPEVWAHGNELNQVWTNLLDNAADALKDGDEAKKGAHIGLKIYRDGHCAVIEISDNGGGIPEEVKTRIFEPFFTTKAVGSGTGLGLDIVHRIVVSRHGGDISVHCDENGTTFSVRLPFEAS